jgi:molybdopterin-binding protein
MLSARNQLKAAIKSVKLDVIMAEIVVKVGEADLVAVITRDSAERLQLKAGDTVATVIKSTEAMIAKEYSLWTRSPAAFSTLFS